MTDLSQKQERPLIAIAEDSSLPLTETQREIWLAARVSEVVLGAHNNTIIIHLRGELNRDAMHECLQELVDRHDALRTSFDLLEPKQYVNAAVTIEMSVVDFTQTTQPEQQSELDTGVRSESNQAFDLTKAPLLRAWLARLSASHHILLLTAQQLVADSWSVGVLLDELKVLYANRAQGRSAHLAPPLQFREYLRLLNESAQTESMSDAEAYWLQQFADGPTPADLPTDFQRPVMRSYHAGRESCWLGPDLSQTIRTASTRQDCSPQALLLAVFKVLVTRLTGQEDLVVAIPAPGQTAAWLRQGNGNDGLVGNCVNFVLVRSCCRNDRTFTDYLKTLESTVQDAYKHQGFTYGSLLTKMKIPRDPSRASLVSALFNLDRVSTEFSLHGLETEVQEVPHRAALFDLELNVRFDKNLQIACIFNPDLFAASTIQRWLSHYQALLADALSNPDKRLWELALLTTEQARQILAEWNATERDYQRDCSVQGLFETQAKETPEAVSVVYSNRQLTYAELNMKANKLARHLRGMGVGPEVLVGFSVERSEEMIVGLLGILKAGGAYVPLDPHWPRRRHEFMLKDARVGVIVTTSVLLSTLPRLEAKVVCLDTDKDIISRQSGVNLVQETRPENLAYVIYTSGSTGRPKGVQVPARALVNLLTAMRHEPGMKPDDVLLAVTTLSFDIAGLEMFLPLIVGARIVVASRETALDGRQLMELMESSGTTVMQATPASWRLLLEAGWKGSRRLKVLCGGEPLPRELARDLLNESGSLWNLYGPTETTVWSTVGQVSLNDQSITIGKPIANTQVYLLDNHMQPAPVGVPGELCIGGDGVARGYLQRAELTAERFVANPFQAGSRLYRTGDLARYLTDGRIECLGRIDRQIKLRGYRIEVGEIETVLSEHPAVRQAVVTIRENAAGDQRLVAYLVLRSRGSGVTGEIVRFLRGKLPEYMVPSMVVPLETLPLTSNGKIDHRALSTISGMEMASTASYVGPRDELERELARLWQELLGIGRIGIKDSFFDLGGHSLQGMRLIGRVEKELGKTFSLATLFQSPTIEELAQELRKKRRLPGLPLLVPFRTRGTQTPIFVHGGSLELSRHLGEDRPCYGLEPHGQDGRRAPETVEEMGADYLRQVRSVQPQGPYLVGGFSFGGLVAFEMARQLRQSGQQVGLLILIDPTPPNFSTAGTREASSISSESGGHGVVGRHWKNLRQQDPGRWVSYLLAGMKWKRQHYARALKMLLCCAYFRIGRRIPSGLRMLYFFETSEKAAGKYMPSPYNGPVVLLQSQSSAAGSLSVWREFISGDLKIHQLPGDHLDAIIGPQVEVWGSLMKESLVQAGRRC